MSSPPDPFDARQDLADAPRVGGAQRPKDAATLILTRDAKRPEVLLCDEPTGALDVKTGVTVLEAIERVNRELGTTTVVITHNAPIADIADRVLRLADGRIVETKVNAHKLPASGLVW